MADRVSTKQRISLLDGIDRKTGRIIQEGHELNGQVIANKEFRFESSTGSTVGIMTLLELKENGVSPKKIILGKPDSNIIAGCILARIPVEVEGIQEIALPRSELEKLSDVPAFLRNLLVAEARIVQAPGFIPVEAVQISGVSYKTIGEAGLKMLRLFVDKNLKVCIPTTLNPAGMDLEEWESQEIPKQFAKKQLEIVELFKKLGVSMTVSCIPYDLVSITPGSHLAFGESSAVAFVNSVKGCYSNRENPIKGLVAALSGYTVEYGMHLQENRTPDARILVECELNSESDYGALGYFAGKLCSIPFYEGITPDSRGLKALAAAGAASGDIPLYYVKDLKLLPSTIPDDLKVLKFTSKDLKAVYEELNTTTEPPNLIAIGCPHYNLEDLKRLEPLLRDKKFEIPFWISTARKFKEQAEEISLKKRLEDTGATVYADCCMVVAPIEKMGFRITATNSAKAAKYLKTLCDQKVIFKKLADIIITAENIKK